MFVLNPQVVDGLRLLHSDMLDARQCTAEELRAALIAVARARTSLRECSSQHATQATKVRRRCRLAFASTLLDTMPDSGMTKGFAAVG